MVGPNGKIEFFCFIKFFNVMLKQFLAIFGGDIETACYGGIEVPIAGADVLGCNLGVGLGIFAISIL